MGQQLIRRLCILTGIAFAVVLALRGASAPRDWMRTARVFLFDAYQYPFAPKLEFDAEAVAKTMTDMHVNTIRFPVIGKYATISGVRFSPHPDQHGRDLLAEMIAAAKPRGIRVVVYIGTGHKLAWSMVTRDHPEYAQQTSPGGLPDRTHFFAGEDHGTICWNTPYRKAFLDMVEHVVRDYDVDGIYFDRWTPFYFWPQPRVCYCEGCRNGFRKASGKELPYHAVQSDYTPKDLETIARYHDWYRDQLIGILTQTVNLVKKYKDIPLIANINNPHLMATEDARLLGPMDAFLYERGASMLERAEGVSLARAAGFQIWPYIGGYHNWPRVAYAGFDYSQEVYTTIAFGGAPIVAQPTGYVEHIENRKYLREPFALLSEHENDLRGFENVPFIAAVYGETNPPEFAKTAQWWKTDARSATLGAFAACLYRHVQVTSTLDRILDHPDELARYRVVYLAGSPYLSPKRIENIKNYVRNGGGLVVSYGTSLYSDTGQRESTFGLENLIRVRPAKQTEPLADMMRNYSTILGGPSDLYLLARPASTRLRSGWKGKLVPLWFYEPVEVLEGGAVVMDIVTGDGRRRVLPGVVASQYGKGRVLYCASSIESLFAGNREEVLGDLIRDLTLSVSATPPPFQIDAPSSVIANLTSNGSRRVLHLVNWTGDKYEKTHANEYYLAPVENVTIRLPEADGIREIHVYPAKSTNHRRGSAFEIATPRVEEYQAVAWQEQK